MPSLLSLLPALLLVTTALPAPALPDSRTMPARKSGESASLFPPSRELIHRYIDVYEYPDGEIEIRADGQSLRYERYDRLGQIDGAAIVENKRLGHALKAALILQAQRDDRRLKAPSRTHRGKASQPLRAAPGTKPASQFTPEDMAIAVRQVCGQASAPKPRPHRHAALATT